MNMITFSLVPSNDINMNFTALTFKTIVLSHYNNVNLVERGHAL